MTAYRLVDETSFVIQSFLSPAHCQQLIDSAEQMGFTEALVNTRSGEIMRKDIRNNERAIWHQPELAQRFWTLLQAYFPTDRFWLPVGLDARFRFYRYDKSQQFDWHRDGSVSGSNGERSRWTLLIYLNDDFEGGATTIEEVDIRPQTGMALIFQHHRRHKGQPVSSGRKYVLRTDVMCAKNQSPSETENQISQVIKKAD